MTEKVLITGASSGIGRAVAYAFAAQRSELFLVARRRERLEEVVQECRLLGSPRALFSTQDLSVKDAGGSIVQLCLQQLGALDILICNAGYGVIGPVQEVTPAQMERVWQVNYQSGYESIHAALPHFLEKGRGHIVLVSSIVGKKGMPYSAVYSATKFAQVGLGEALWGELKNRGIGVSVICPGYTDTEFQQSAEKTKNVRRKINRTFKGQSSGKVAEAIVQAVRRKRREIHLTLAGRLLLLIDRFSNTAATRLLAAVAKREREVKTRS